MRNWLIKSTSILIIAILVFASMAGCSKTTPMQSSSITSSMTSSEPVKADPVKFTLLLRAGPEFLPDNNAWVQEINKKANAVITWMAVPIANIWEKRNVTMASNDYPEVIIMNTTSSGINDNLYDQMVKSKIILPLDDYIKNAPNIMKYTHPVTWEAIRYTDGKTYMIPRCTIIREDFMEIRKDWREKLKLSVPKTTGDWLAFFKAVASQDPDGNGKADTYGTTESSEMMTLAGTINLEFFARTWHADKQWYVNGKGEVFYGVFAKDGRFKNALEFYRQMMLDKSIDPDLITNKGVAAKFEKFKTGMTAAVREFVGTIDADLTALRKLQPTATVELVEFPVNPESATYKDEKNVQTNAGLYNGWALTNKAAGKEQAIVNVMDWMLGDEGWNVLNNGVEGVQYKTEGGKVVRLQPAYADFTKWIGHLQLFRRPNDKDLWLKNSIPELVTYQQEWLTKSVNFLKDNYVQKGLLGVVSPKEIEFLKKDIYTKKYVEVTAKIIFGELPLSAWDDFIKEVYANGWADVEKEYNDYFTSHK